MKWSQSVKISLFFLALAIIIGALSFLKQDRTPEPDSKLAVERTNEREVRMVDGVNEWELEWLAPDIVRVQLKPNGEEEPFSAVMDDRLSERAWSPFALAVDEQAHRFLMKSDELTLEIDRQKKTVRFSDMQGERLLQLNDLTTATREMLFEYDRGDHLYGIHGFNAGETSHIKMLRKEANEIEAGVQGGAGAPLIWSRNGYGLLFDSAGGTLFDMDGQFSFSYSTKKDTQFFLLAGKPQQIMRNVAELSGKPQMFPKWALGFNNSEWGIDQQELLRDVRLYRQKQIPIDHYTLDFDWKAWGEDNYGESRWNEQKFPDGASGKLKETLDAVGLKLTGIMKPRIHVDTVQGRYADEHNFWWPNKQPYPDYFSLKPVNVLNFALPEMRAWYFNDYVKQAFATGIIGWWNDEADEQHDNLQFMNMQKTLYEGQRSISNLRVWSINRNFFLGSQRYAYSMWSGDISTGFFSMANQRERMLSAINLGQVKWGMDTGGFHGTPSAENYARWVQFSAFTPMFRVHGTLNEQRQPWYYGAQAEQIAKRAIELRYTLLPYMYAYERRALETGTGLVQPLFHEYPEDETLANHIDSWMFGDHLLVSPVVEEGQNVKDIYLPEGTWIDWFRGTVYQGGQTISYKLNAATWEDIPLFIRSGAIIPTYPVMNYVGEKVVSDVRVDLFPSENTSRFVYYDDDGRTYDYEKGIFFRQPMEMKASLDGLQTARNVQIRLAAAGGTYKPDVQRYVLHVHGIAAKSVTGSDIDWSTKTGSYGPYTELLVPAGKPLTLELSR